MPPKGSKAFVKRRESLRKKAWELSVLCGVRVAVVCAGGEGVAAEPDVYESEAGVLAAYRALPAAARAAHTQCAHVDAELGKAVAKLARVRQGGPAALPGWDKALNDAGAEEARRVMADVDAAMAAVEARQRALGMPLLLVGDGHGDEGGLIEGVVQGGGDGKAGQYEQATWGHGVHPGYSFHQYPGGGAETDCYQLQMASHGHNDTRLGWDDAFQPHPGYASQCYGGLLQPNSHNGVGYPTLDLGLGYNDNFQVYGGGDFVNAPPALSSSHAMATGDNCFMNPAPAQPLAMYAGGYTTQWPAQQQQQQMQSASSSRQSSIEHLHYFSDVEDGLQLWES